MKTRTILHCLWKKSITIKEIILHFADFYVRVGSIQDSSPGGMSYEMLEGASTLALGQCCSTIVLVSFLACPRTSPSQESCFMEKL